MQGRPLPSPEAASLASQVSRSHRPPTPAFLSRRTCRQRARLPSQFNDEYVAKHHEGKWRSAAEMREALIASTAMQRIQQLDKQLEDAVVKVRGA